MNGGSQNDPYKDYNNDGTLMNSPVWSGGGKSGNCLGFDGVDDHVRVPLDKTDFDTGNYLTVSCWFKSTVDQTGKALICVDEYSTTYKYRLYCGTNKALQFAIRNPDNTLQYVQNSLPESFYDGKWHHVVGTYNRFASDGNRLKLYFDGVKIAQSIGFDKPLLRGNNYVYIGKFSGDYFKGYIDEVQVRNYSMTESEVTNLYNNY